MIEGTSLRARRYYSAVGGIILYARLYVLETLTVHREGWVSAVSVSTVAYHAAFAKNDVEVSKMMLGCA